MKILQVDYEKIIINEKIEKKIYKSVFNHIMCLFRIYLFIIVLQLVHVSENVSY